MDDIVQKTRAIIEACALALNIQIVDVEWVKERGNFILRILADTKSGLSIDDATALNEAVSIKLDEVDLISQEYFLEVSSPGLERELKNDADIAQSIGKYVHIRIKEAVDEKKIIEGILMSFANGQLVLEVKDKTRTKTFEIKQSNIRKIRLAVQF